MFELTQKRPSHWPPFELPKRPCDDLDCARSGKLFFNVFASFLMYFIPFSGGDTGLTLGIKNSSGQKHAIQVLLTKPIASYEIELMVMSFLSRFYCVVLRLWWRRQNVWYRWGIRNSIIQRKLSVNSLKNCSQLCVDVPKLMFYLFY